MSPPEFWPHPLAVVMSDIPPQFWPCPFTSPPPPQRPPHSQDPSPPLSTSLCGAPPSPAPGGEWCPSPFAAPGAGRISLGREVGWGCAYGVSCLTCGGKMGLGLPGVLYLRFGGVWGGSQGEVLWMTGVGGASGVPWGYHLGQVWCMCLSRGLGRDWGSPGGVCVYRGSLGRDVGESLSLWGRSLLCGGGIGGSPAEVYGGQDVCVGLCVWGPGHVGVSP